MRRISHNIIVISRDDSQLSPILNCSTWARKIIIASPFTNPSITGWGISLTSFPSQNIQKNICRAHISTKVAKRKSIQYVTTSDVITTASAHVAQDIIHGLPQNIAIISPTIKAAWSQTIGFTPATNEKAIASGTRARATVSHDKISVFNWFLSWSSWNKELFFTYVSNNIEETSKYINKNSSSQFGVAIFSFVRVH